jgi:predicted ABC-type ATPase
MKKIIIIAGPNGAGKTTFAREEVAFAAGRLMLKEIARHITEQKCFAFETTLAGLAYLRQIPAWRDVGY